MDMVKSRILDLIKSGEGNQEDLMEDKISAATIEDRDQELHTDIKYKNVEMKRLVDKYGKPEELWLDPTSADLHKLYCRRVSMNDHYIAQILRQRTSLLSFFFIHDKNEERTIMIKNLKKDNSILKKDNSNLRKDVNEFKKDNYDLKMDIKKFMKKMEMVEETLKKKKDLWNITRE